MSIPFRLPGGEYDNVVRSGSAEGKGGGCKRLGSALDVGSALVAASLGVEATVKDAKKPSECADRGVTLLTDQTADRVS